MPTKLRQFRHALLLAIAGCATLAPLPALAAPGDMPIATFLPRAERLQASGVTAVFASDFNTLMGEVQAAAKAYHTRLLAERAAGHPSSCPPKEVRFSTEDIMGHMKTYPPATQPTTTVKAAMADLFIKRYPCGR